MVRKLLLLGLLAMCPAAAYAHLCNDVFAQARDNLVVKVDVRDGQLRIGQEGAFRVYLLNTMDREISAISLQVLSDHFDAGVQPSPDWREHPRLLSVKSGGKKQYFTVSLRRKAGVPDGRYRIDLRLTDARNKERVFKTVDLASAACVCALAPAVSVKIDGLADRTEWAESFPCTDFYAYVKKGSGFENERAQSQARFRLAMDAENLYGLLQFHGGEQATADTAVIYIAPASEASPVVFQFDRVSGALSSEHRTEGIEYAVSPDRTFIECKIPRALLRPQDQPTDPVGYYVNFTRTATVGGKQHVTYWRGNSFSVLDPIVYGYFTIGTAQQPAQ